ncbi:hypothetical protein [Elizabethkingia meningoseptica]|uniref:hypothetical protein n=1 Tax=Elizabethkingia meningoseptica TaxID=238 RepID=UPI00293D13BC|nr:hypothetical protein [Elizabethkingia anophelis]MDV3710159.1 hypothetical protein [Elizabethkingia anophelis]MDV3733624.1 hypothetical protein [Elizabethkingia anophelis]
MKAPVNIHPPKNWQDFETLCLKMWGEIWNIPHEIEFNSDNSQGQNGVDIYGPIDNGLKYNGIQCKNKKLNLIDGKPNRISIQDIQAEIEKAKSFIPSLNKLIIATSLPKDQKIEEYVRTQSIKNIENGNFSIQICFWEFFERKLVEFPNIYNWYIKNEDFHRVKQLSVTFNNGSLDAICNPKFQKTIKRYIYKPKPDNLDDEFDFSSSLEGILAKFNPSEKQSKNNLNELYKNIKPNHSLIAGQNYVWGQICWLKLQITNTGESVIEDFKIELDFEGDFVKVGAESGHYLTNPNFTNNVKEYSNTERSLYVKPKNQILVQNDSFNTGNFYIKPKVSGENNEVILNWKLLSRDFTDSGSLRINIKPKFHTVIIDKYIDNIEDEREEISYKIFERPGISNLWGNISYLDKESDYNFE